MKKTFDTWWEESGQHWAAAATENDGILWTHDEQKVAALRQAGLPAVPEHDLRRALFDRRYQRPEPPHGMEPINSIRSSQRRYANIEPAQHHQSPVDNLQAA